MKIIQAVSILVLCGSLPALAKDCRTDDSCPAAILESPRPQAVETKGIPVVDREVIYIMRQQQQTLVDLQRLVTQMLLAQQDMARMSKLREDGAAK